jgi:hypothetical protein
MARKQLIKGANASRVEERIARVPADLVVQSSTIFGAIKAMEGDSAATIPESAAAPRKAAPRKAASKQAEPKRVEEKRQEPRKPAKPPESVAKPVVPEQRPALASSGGKLKVSDFTATEREAIVRCCSDYRNRLPTYLLAVQKEVKIIDSVIEKCKVPGRKKG